MKNLVLENPQKSLEIKTKEGESLNLLVLPSCDLDLKIYLKGDSNLLLCILPHNFESLKILSQIYFLGKGASADHLILYLAKANQNLEIFAQNLHKAESAGEIILKGALKDNSRSNFEGTVRIEKKAQKSKAFLRENILLLSNQAKSRSLPSLEVLASDVQAGHGATLSKIDQNQIFYLQSRGLSRKQAEELILEGFFEEQISKVRNLKFQKIIRREIFQNALLW